MSRNGDSDEYQLVVEATPPPPQRRPRTPNPAVDDVIQSGEINAPRSMVIRSTSQPVMAAMTEQRAVAELAPPKKKKTAALVWLAAALAPAVAAIALEVVKPAKPAAVKTTEADSLAQLLGTMFDTEARGAQVRAEAIASSAMLRAAIVTDANTLADMAKDRDVVFPHKAGETIEVFQTTGNRTSMIRIPDDAPAVTPPPAGTTRVEQRGNTIVVIADAPVTSQKGAVSGEVALVAPVDLSAIAKRPFEQLTGVTLTGFANPVKLGGPPPVADGSTVVAQVAMSAAKGPALAVTALIATPKEDTSNYALVRKVRYACAGLALVFLLVFGVTLLKR